MSGEIHILPPPRLSLAADECHRRARDGYLSRLSRASRDTQWHSLVAAARALGFDADGGLPDVPWADLTAAHLATVRRELLDQGRAPASINRVLAAVRGVLRAAWRQGTLSADELARAVDVPGVINDRDAAGRVLPAGEIRALFGAAGASAPAVRDRDRAALVLLYGCGLRRSEAAALRWEDLEGARLVVRGKGDRVRAVYVPPSGVRLLERWLERSRELAQRHPMVGYVVGADADGNRELLAGPRFRSPVLIALSRRGIPTGGGAPLTPRSVYYIVQRLAQRAGVRRLSPHDLRRSYVTHLLAANADYRAVQMLVGHRSIETTAGYDRRGEDAARQAADLLHLPECDDDDD